MDSSQKQSGYEPTCRISGAEAPVACDLATRPASFSVCVFRYALLLSFGPSRKRTNALNLGYCPELAFIFFHNVPVRVRLFDDIKTAVDFQNSHGSPGFPVLAS